MFSHVQYHYPMFQECNALNVSLRIAAQTPLLLKFPCALLRFILTFIVLRRLASLGHEKLKNADATAALQLLHCDVQRRVPVNSAGRVQIGTGLQQTNSVSAAAQARRAVEASTSSSRCTMRSSLRNTAQ